MRSSIAANEKARLKMNFLRAKLQLQLMRRITSSELLEALIELGEKYSDELVEILKKKK